MMTNDQISARVWAVLTTVLDGRRTDVDALLADLEPEDLGTVVCGLADLAVNAVLPSDRTMDPAARQTVADHLRVRLLRARAAEDGS